MRLPRDHYVRLDSCDYSVHPSAIGFRVEVAADLATVRIIRAAAVVGEHERCWARQQTITDQQHAKAAAALRQAYQDQPRGKPDDGEVACRDLADYDRLLGVCDELTGQEVAR